MRIMVNLGRAPTLRPQSRGLLPRNAGRLSMDSALFMVGQGTVQLSEGDEITGIQFAYWVCSGSAIRRASLWSSSNSKLGSMILLSQ
jgi:hypothetical protein